MISNANIYHPFNFLTEGGRAGTLLRSIDWAKSSLGSTTQWPSSLKNTIRMALDNGAPMYIVWGPENNQFYNDAFLPIIGFENFYSLMGKSADKATPDHWPYVQPMITEILNGATHSFENLKLPLKRNGVIKDCFFSFSASPIRDDNGSFEGILLIANETTNRVLIERRLISERERLRVIADRLPAFITYVGIDGKYKFVNSVFAEWMGKPRSEVEGKHRSELIGDKMTFEYMEAFQKRAFAGERVRFELFFSKPTGEYIVLDTEYLPDIDPKTKEVRGIICVGQNITERRKALLEAEKAQRELREIFMQTPLPMAIMTGPDHKFTLANPYYVRFVGREVLNKAMLDVFSLAEVENFLPCVDKVYREGKSALMKETPLRTLSSNGKMKEMILNVEYHPYKDSLGNTIGVMAIIHNVTDQVLARKKVEESEERYRTLADTIPQLMWTATPAGKINYANERCAQYSGMDSQHTYSKNWIQTIHPSDLPIVSRSWMRSIKNGKPFKEEYRIRRSDGVYRWFLGRALPVRNQNKEILYWNGTATDIEENKRIESELEAARELAENANKTKSAFLANMSHEIRTPLGAILGFSELLKNNELSPAIRDQYIETISRSGESLSRIIDDILDLAKVEAGRLDIEHINFSFPELINEVIDLLSQKAQQKNINLNLHIDQNVPRYLYSDPARLRQIFINIIGNAVKFTDFGQVAVYVKSDKAEDGSLKMNVIVADTGRGLDEEQIDRLFKPFSQADNTTTRQYGGTGLGLALSKRLAEALGGSISIDKFEKDKGCTFSICFAAILGVAPIEKIENASAELTCVSDSLPLSGMQILFADDSPDNQFLVEHFLTINGAEVSLASDGNEAVEKALLGSFNLILMDIQMPNMDGYQATKVLMNRGFDRPIIALTAHAMDEEREKTKSLGFSGHLTKPFNFNELLQTVAKHACNNNLKGNRKL